MEKNRRDIKTPSRSRKNISSKPKRCQKKAFKKNKSRLKRPRHTAKIYKSGVKKLIGSMFKKMLHHKQVLSIFMVTYGIFWSSRLGVASLGRSMAQAFGKSAKHGIKQVDRFLSNKRLERLTLFQGLVPIVIGNRPQIYVALDWTEFDKDDHSTLVASLITSAKRTKPLVWLTVKKSNLKGKQRFYERMTMLMLYSTLPKGTKVIIVADRGFGDVEFYSFIQNTLGFDFVIRYRQVIHVSMRGKMQDSASLVPKNGRIRLIKRTALTEKRKGPYTVVLYKAAGMKEPWCLATSLHDLRGKEIVNIYSRRFQCEETFRDLKDPRFGLGLRLTKIRDGMRRERFIFVFVLAFLILSLMGVISEKLGLDRHLRANTEKKRTHSLFNQGRALFGNIAADSYHNIANMFNRLLKLLVKEGALAIFS